MTPDDVSDIVAEEEVHNIVEAWKWIEPYTIFRRYRNIGCNVELDIQRARIFSIIETKLADLSRKKNG